MVRIAANNTVYAANRWNVVTDEPRPTVRLPVTHPSVEAPRRRVTRFEANAQGVLPRGGAPKARPQGGVDAQVLQYRMAQRPAGNAVGSITSDRATWLCAGMSGPAVADLQQRLKDAGFDPGPIDGDFGPRTRAAVMAYQRAAGISVDGLVGPQTQAALLGNTTQAPTGTPGGGTTPTTPTEPTASTGTTQTARDLEALALQKHGPAFVEKVHQIAARLGIKPEWLLAVMKNESGMSPSIVNPNGGATGLIQFMPATARALGTTTQALAQMSATQQLDYVEKYYANYKGKLSSGADLYLATFWPAALGKPDSYNIGGAGTARGNSGFDLDHNGQITAGEFRRYYLGRFPELA